MIYRILVVMFFSLIATEVFGAEEPVLDFFRSKGKINVVVAVLVAIFIGIVLFLISLDRKISRLENRIKDE